MESKDLLKLLEGESNPMGLLLESLNTLKIKEGYEQDLLTPGFIKELMISKLLGHQCHKTKHGPDATLGNESYEYLSCKQGGSFQLDRIHKNNLHRIERNDAFYFALFDKDNGLDCIEVYKGETDIVLDEAKKKISKMKDSSNHIGFSYNWVKKNCKLVYNKRK